jgi:hypothetical protein
MEELKIIRIAARHGKKIGSDALGLSLSSPVVLAENLNFSRKAWKNPWQEHHGALECL